MNFLFIGNSFTYFYDVPLIFEERARRAGLDVKVDQVLKGGWYLCQYADKNDEYGKIVDEKLNSDVVYDRIILQEQSSLPIRDRNEFESSIAALLKKIYQNNPKAKVTLYATWGYQDGHEDLRPLNMNCEEMTIALKKAYHEAAEKFSLDVVDVGTAFYEMDKNTELNPYYKDLKHPSVVGSTLSAYMHLYHQFPELEKEDLEIPRLPDKKEGILTRDLAYRFVRESC